MRPTPALTEAGYRTFVHLLRARAAVTRRVDAALARHGLTISDYEVLHQLASGPVRRVDLAVRVLLTPSGITRLLAGLERGDLVVRLPAMHDARVTFTELTPAGRALLAEADATVFEALAEAFGQHYSEDELELLSALLARVPGVRQ